MRKTEQDTKEIYILLIRTQSLLSRVIHIATKEPYTHVSIGMASDCTQFYSFARRYARLPLPAGFVHESIESGMMARCKDAPCALYRLNVSQTSYRAIRRKFKRMLPVQRRFQYSVLGTFLCFFGIAYKRRNKYFCSQFVAETLNEVGAMKLTKLPELYHPVDFAKLPEMELCYEGTLGGLEKKRFCLSAG